jgi:hypothetical protein
MEYEERIRVLPECQKNVDQLFVKTEIGRREIEESGGILTLILQKAQAEFFQLRIYR